MVSDGASFAHEEIYAYNVKILGYVGFGGCLRITVEALDDRPVYEADLRRDLI